MRILLLITLSSVLLLETLSHHIIFENIGQLASAVTYIHAKVAINFTTIEDQHLLYIGMLHSLNARLHTLPVPKYNYSDPVDEEKLKPIDRMLYEDLKQSQQVLMFYILSASWITTEVEALRLAMPVPTPSDNFMIRDQPTPHNHSHSPSHMDTLKQGFQLIPNKEGIGRKVFDKIKDKLYITHDTYVERFRLPRFTSLLMLSVETIF